MVNKILKDTYLGGPTTTALQNGVSTCQQMYYNKETRVMVNQSVNDFYIHFLFKIDALPHNVALPLDIAVTFFKNFSPDIREFLISEGVQVPPRTPTETNRQGNHRLLLVINEALEVEKKIIKIKSVVQPASRSCNTRTLMGMICEKTLNKNVWLGKEISI